MATELKERSKYNAWEIITRIYCMFILTIFPCWVDTKGYSAITECKFNTFRSTAVVYYIALILTLVYFLIFKKDNIFKVRDREIRFKVTLPQMIITAFVIWNAISALTSRFGKDTWIGQGRYEGMCSCLLYSSVFILVSFFGEYSKWYKRGIAIATMFFSLLAFRQFFKDGIIYPYGYTFWDARFMSTIGNVDMVGGLVSLFIPVLFCSYVFTKEKYWQYIYLACVASLTYLFIVADVDSAKVGLLVGFVFAFCFLVDERKNLIRSLEAMGTFTAALFLAKFLNLSKEGFKPHMGKKALVLLLASLICFGLAFLLKKTKFSLGWSKDKARKIALIAMLAVIFICLVFVFFYKGDVTLLKEASEVMHFKLSDNAGSGRGYLWKSALGLAAETPIKGNGPGTFGESYKHLDRFSTYTDFAHNDFIQIAVCVGFVGLAIYIAFILSLAVRALKKAKDCEYLVVFGAACAAYLAHSFFSFSLAIITPIFWVMAGLVDKIVRQME